MQTFTVEIDTCQPHLEKSYMKQYQKHETGGFLHYIVCNGKKLEPVLYTKKSEDKNIAHIFVDRLQNDIEREVSHQGHNEGGTMPRRRITGGGEKSQHCRKFFL